MKGLESHNGTYAPRRSRSRAAQCIFPALFGILCYHVITSWIFPQIQHFISLWDQTSKERTVSTGEFDWATISAFSELDFQPCYNSLKCARLELPLDYWNGTNPSGTISLAVVKVPARVSITDPRYGGPILLNPGGPGGSGVNFAAGAGKHIQTLVDSREDPANSTDGNNVTRYYDIIGFDPRGIGWTFPNAHCFDSPSDRITWNLRTNSEGNLDSSNAALGRLWSMKQAFGSGCYWDMEFGSDIKEFITTASVARDMVELIEALGRHRQREAKALLSVDAATSGKRVDLSTYSKLRHVPGEEKLQYWGFSYGTQLGSTFASMFPNRVGRMILDGVVNAENYSKMLWSENLHDTEKVMQHFYDSCAAAPGNCALAEAKSTPDDIKMKVESIWKDLYHNPMPVGGPGIGFPEVLTYSDVRSVVFSALYFPLASFRFIAVMLAAIERRDISGFAEILHSLKSCGCQLFCKPTEPYPINDGESTVSIMCGDGDPQDRVNITYFDENHLQKLERMSPTGGAVWAMARLNCIGWKIRPPYRYNQSYGGNTSHPILWIGNAADPVTPVFSAHKMSTLFPNSVVLTQDSAGHCSLSAFSSCTIGYIKKYFHTGELPPNETVCPIEAGQTPFNSGITISVPAEPRVLPAHKLDLTAHEEISRLRFENTFRTFRAQRMPLCVWE